MPQVCICATTPDGNQLWMGHISGKVLVYKYWFETVKNAIQFDPEATALLGHSSTISSLSLCRGFSVAISGSKDATAIIWDLNTLVLPLATFTAFMFHSLYNDKFQ